MTQNKDYLAHYGVKGQKWGSRQWQNEDGTYTEAGKHHYGWGYGRQTTAQPQKSSTARTTRPSSQVVQRQRRPIAQRQASSANTTRAQQEAIRARRKQRAKKILIAAGVVAVAAAASYGAYKYSKNRSASKLTDNVRDNGLKLLENNKPKSQTALAKTADRVEKRTDKSFFKSLSKTGRLDKSAISAGERFRKDVHKLSRGGNIEKMHNQFLNDHGDTAYAKFMRKAEKNKYLNQSIRNVRQQLGKEIHDLTSRRTAKKIRRKYEAELERKQQEVIRKQREKLNGLLMRRRQV